MSALRRMAWFSSLVLMLALASRATLGAPLSLLYQSPPVAPPPGPPAWVNKPVGTWTPADHSAHATHVGQCSWYLLSTAATTAWSFVSSAAAAVSPFYTFQCGAFAPPAVFELARPARVGAAGANVYPTDDKLSPAGGSRDAVQVRDRVQSEPTGAAGASDSPLKRQPGAVLGVVLVDRPASASTSPVLSLAPFRRDRTPVSLSIPASGGVPLNVLITKPLATPLYRPITTHDGQRFIVAAAAQPTPFGRLQGILIGKKK